GVEDFQCESVFVLEEKVSHFENHAHAAFAQDGLDLVLAVDDAADEVMVRSGGFVAWRPPRAWRLFRDGLGLDDRDRRPTRLRHRLAPGFPRAFFRTAPCTGRRLRGDALRRAVPRTGN